MENLMTYLPALIYILLCILIVLLIIICIKVLNTMNKVEKVVDDAQEKVRSLNGFFNIFDVLADKLSSLTEVLSDSVITLLKSVFKKRNKKIKEEKGYDEDE